MVPPMPLPQQKPKQPQIRVCVWIDQCVADLFHAANPEHGALTRFMRDAVTQHVKLQQQKEPSEHAQ